jgi:hypothetical protein
MTEFFYIFELIFILFIIFTVRRYKSRLGNGNPVRTLKPVEYTKRPQAAKPSAELTFPVKETARKSATTLRDNKYDDWLAKQLMEENRALAKVSDMFQLKQSHANNCDAEFIRRFHEASCDAGGVDDGEKRK